MAAMSLTTSTSASSSSTFNPPTPCNTQPVPRGLRPLSRCRAATRVLAAMITMALVFAFAVSAQAAKVTRVSVSTAGDESDGLSREFGISRSGRLVSFMSDASTLVDGDTNGVRDVFVHDRWTGVTRRISVSSEGAEGNAASTSGVISEDGKYVVFHSRASNLVPNDTNGENDVFVHNLETGETRRVSVSSEGVESDGNSTWATISKTGRYVAFRSDATNLVPGDTNGVTDAFVHDLVTGETTRVSITTSGAEPDGASTQAVISPNGRYVAVVSAATNVVPNDTNGSSDVFVHDRRRGTTALVSIGLAGEGANGDSYDLAFSGNNIYLAFTSWASNLVPDDNNGTRDVFVWNRIDRIITRASVSSSGEEGNGESLTTSLSRAGHLVFFASLASNLVSNDTNEARDAFVHDRTTGETIRLSVAANGVEGNGDSSRPKGVRNGRIVTFYSVADNLVPNDLNGVDDVFVLRRGPSFWQVLR
jgi:hypothetical protein